VRKFTRGDGRAPQTGRSLSAAVLIEDEKRIAAEAAAQLVRDGDLVGLGTGSTVAYLLPALAARRLRIRCVATSPATAQVAAQLGIDVIAFEQLERLDIAIDGADQITSDGWLVKGGGGAHTREKIVASAAARFVVVASSNKLVGALKPPIPLELLRFGLEATLTSLGMAGRWTDRRLRWADRRTSHPRRMAVGGAWRRRARAVRPVTEHGDRRRQWRRGAGMARGRLAFRRPRRVIGRN
jgi:ribose 5-phosphate isomerase